MSIHSLPLGGSVPRDCAGGAITIGNFDGVHLGHQALLTETVRRAKAHSGPAVAVTFSVHPLKLLRPATFEPELTTLEQRCDLLLQQGADHVVVLETTPELLQLGAGEFFRQIIVERLRARAIVEGFNFGFGRNREGTLATLQELGEPCGIAVHVLAALEIDGKPVSSSRVRHEIQAGNVVAARSLLGRPFRIAGTVGTGQKRGQSLGFPTANLEHIPTLIPGHGVYAVRVHYGKASYAGAANIGPNPTFGESARKVEVHLIGYSGDLYGQYLWVDFLEKLRETTRFGSVDQLKAQLEVDVARAKASRAP